MHSRHAQTPAADPRSLLPLTPIVFQVLMALADGDRHGYAIIREVDTRTDGLMVLRTGTLYTVLKRLLELDIVEESDKRPSPEKDDERRRYYRMTPFGRSVMEAEARRLDSLVALARDKRVLKARKA
ncbi:MAG: PadR family transcriptional regulator [Acidobacteriota bacterium]|nr:PadR family transcriptional regulator [Acidobacteriota bacterium]